MDKETKERIERCARILKVTGNGQLIIEAGCRLIYKVSHLGYSRTYSTLDELEAFTESLLANRHRPSPNIRHYRRKYVQSQTLNYTHA